MYSKELAELGFVVFRRQNDAGGIKPHLFIRFKSEEGRLLTFAIDTTRVPASQNPPDAYLITHAHSDHYGKSAMLSNAAWCSDETARALEIRYEKKYAGNTFQTGDSFSVCGVKIQTFDVCHTPGSSAFYWENELGNSILVTGDVKDAQFLPKCDILLTEASYGDPADLSCYFEDDIDGLHHAVLSHIGERRIAFGAYEFGKSQKTVSILREMGYNGPIAMNGKTLSLTENFVQNAGELIEINHESFYSARFFSETRISVSIENKAAATVAGAAGAAGTGSIAAAGTAVTDAANNSAEFAAAAATAAAVNAAGKAECNICIVPISDLPSFGADTQKYVLTCRRDYPFENIRLSDHLDVNGLTKMVKDISPQIAIIYHPDKSSRTDKFARHLEKNGFKAFSINQIQNIVGNEKKNKSVD